MSFDCVLTRARAAGVVTGLVFAIAGCGESGKGGTGGATGGSSSGTAGATSAGAGGSGTAGAGKGGTGTGAGTGGTSGAGTSGGGGNSACSAEPYEHTFGFGALFEGWSISTYSTPSLTPMAGSGGGGTGGVGGNGLGGEGGDTSGGIGGASPTGTIMELDTSDGAPDSPDGSLKLTIPFDAPAQLLLLGQVFNTNLNFTGTRVTAQIKLDSGLIVGPSDTGRANLVVKSTDGFVYNQGPAVVLDPSAGWATLTLDPDMPTADALSAGYSACQIREIDIEIHTADMGNYREAVVHIDAISVAPKP